MATNPTLSELSDDVAEVARGVIELRLQLYGDPTKRYEDDIGDIGRLQRDVSTVKAMLSSYRLVITIGWILLTTTISTALSVWQVLHRGTGG